MNENIIDMTPMLIIHSDPDVVLFLIEIVRFSSRFCRSKGCCADCQMHGSGAL